MVDIDILFCPHGRFSKEDNLGEVQKAASEQSGV